MKISRNHDNVQSRLHHFRLSLLVAVLIMFSLILVLRLAYLQFSQYKRYATLSLKNQMSIIPIAPPRGIILDKNGVVLAENVPVYVLEIIPERVKNLSQTLEKLKALLPSINEDDIKNFERAHRQNHAYLSIPLKLKLSQEEVAVFASNQYLFPGVSIKARLMRYYPLAETTAHLLGYVGRINIQELQRVNPTNYRATNFIGKAGVENYYEDLLHGHVGYQQIETDVSGRTLRVINKHYKILSNALNRPLYNRAVRGLYPPASTIKPFIAIAGLDKGVINLSSRVYDPGWYRLPGVKHAYRDWKRTGHGVINVKRAITVSCDTFFYQLGNKMGISAIEDMLVQFGFGQLSHVDLHEEAPGLVPSPHWKHQSKSLPWYPGDTLITSIGQGFMLASPLQMANATASLSQHGQRFRPHLLSKFIDDKTQIHRFKRIEEYPIRLKYNENWDIVTDAMHSVITNNEGTGYRFGRNAPYSVAGKTGTAQVFSMSQDDKKHYLNLPESLRDHSLFIGFAPVEKPEIAIAVLVENDSVASSVARKVMDAYFELRTLDNENQYDTPNVPFYWKVPTH